MEVQSPGHTAAAATCCSVSSVEALVGPLNAAIVQLLQAVPKCPAAARQAARSQCNSMGPKLNHPVLPIHLTQHITIPS